MTTNELLAALNTLLVSASLVAMLVGRRRIRARDVRAHRRYMTAAFALQAGFLVGFVYRFVRFGFASFRGGGAMMWLYRIVFFGHEPLALVTVPLVVSAFVTGITRNVRAHRQVAPMAYPVWVYVSATGVALYVLLYFYPVLANARR